MNEERPRIAEISTPTRKTGLTDLTIVSDLSLKTNTNQFQRIYSEGRPTAGNHFKM